jgi:VanZ family protein
VIHRLKQYLPWLILVFYWPLIFIGTHLPRPPEIQIYGNDKTLHFSAYFLLAMVFWFARYGSVRPSVKGRGFYLTIIIMAIYGAVDEITQPLVHRTTDLKDWIGDMGGVLTALGAIYLLRRCFSWLIVYWIGLFIITHWPVKESAFVKIPLFWQQFQVAYHLIAYLILTLLWWRSLSPQPRFVYQSKILILSLLVMIGYAVLDETISVMMGRGFDRVDFFSGCGGVALGVVCSLLLARHYVENNPATDKKLQL